MSQVVQIYTQIDTWKLAQEKQLAGIWEAKRSKPEPEEREKAHRWDAFSMHDLVESMRDICQETEKSNGKEEPQNAHACVFPMTWFSRNWI